MFGRRKHTRTTVPPALQPTHWDYRATTQRVGDRVNWEVTATPYYWITPGEPIKVASGWAFDREKAEKAARRAARWDREAHNRVEEKRQVKL